MDHQFIDENSVTERYLDHALSPRQRAEFEAHLVDCQECVDRLLLAEMFHNRNGASKIRRHVPEQEILFTSAPRGLRVRFVAQFTPWLVVVVLAATAILVVLLPAAFFVWEARVR